jgi:hypothetical protein
MGKKIQTRDEEPGSYCLDFRNNFLVRSESGIFLTLDHISESLETIFWVKILKFFDADPGSGIRNLFDPGSGMGKICIRDLT